MTDLAKTHRPGRPDGHLSGFLSGDFAASRHNHAGGRAAPIAAPGAGIGVWQHPPAPDAPRLDPVTAGAVRRVPGGPPDHPSRAARPFSQEVMHGD